MATVFASGATLGEDGSVIPVVDVRDPSTMPPVEETPPTGSGSADAGPAGEQAPMEPPVLDDEPDDESAEDAADDGREGRPSRRERRKTYVQGVIEENRWLRQQVEQQRQAQAQQAPAEPVAPPSLPPYQVPRPQQYQFGTAEEYHDALIAWHVDYRDYQRQVQWQAQQQAQAVAQAQVRWQQREEEGRERYADFDAVEQRVEIAPHLAPLVADTVRDLEIGADILYFLGTNPKAQKTLNQMDVWAAGRWLGQLQLQLEGKRQRPQNGQVALPSAPAVPSGPPAIPPMQPVGTGGALPVTGFRQGMSLVEYDAQRRAERQALGLRP